MDFIEFCDRSRILLAVLPPHSTPTLQPLDVALFAPLSAAYSKELSQHLERAQGLIPINEGDFFELYWRAWGSSFKTETILSSFAATGINPLNPDATFKGSPTTPQPMRALKACRRLVLATGEGWIVSYARR
jgi:hypothetical protein